MTNSIYNFNSIFYQLDLSALKHFYSVATFGGFSKAARASGQSQPAISLGLQKLEKTLGVILVDRSMREFTLTTEGKALLSFCQSLENNLEATVKSLGANTLTVQKRMKIGAALSLGFGPIINAIADAAASNPPVELELISHRTQEILDMVSDDILDAALVSIDTTSPGLRATKLQQDNLCFIVGPKLKSKFSSTHWYDVIKHTALVTYPRETLMREEVDKICTQSSSKFKTIISANNISTICSLVEAGAGGAFVLQSLVKNEISAKTVCKIEPPFKLPKSGISLVVKASKHGEQILKTINGWMQSK